MFGQLQQAMIAVGIDPGDAALIADGTLHRFWDRIDKRGSENGWYVLHDNGDGTHGAAFGNWKQPGERHTWHSKGERTTAAERADFARRMSATRQRAADEQRQRHSEAEAKAARLWRRARPAFKDHPYLIKKQVAPYGIRQHGEALIIPVRSSTGTLTGLQFINPNGSKQFLFGTAIASNYHAIGGTPGDILLIAEGYATAATLHAATGHPVAVAFNAGNLRPVAVALRAKYHKVAIIICADADDAGRRCAADAAEAVHGSVIEPDFPKGFHHG